MLLTALFAVSIGTKGGINTLSIEYYAGLFLLISIGLCIDISKYLFWYYRKKHTLYLCLSVFLVGFSWLASVAFFVSQDTANIAVNQKKSSAYIANQKRILALEVEIQEKRKLLNKRLSSSYHNQWDKGQEVIKEIEALNQELNTRLENTDSIGLNDGQNQLSTAFLFNTLSSLLSVSFSSAINIAYSIFAFVIEICALGVMSLSQIVNSQAKKSKVDKQDIEDDTVTPENNKNELIKKIKEDVLSGKIKPLVTKIIENYPIRHNEARLILDDLEGEGKIKVKNKRYNLLIDD